MGGEGGNKACEGLAPGGLCKKMPPVPEACTPFGNRVQITVFCISTFNRHLLTAILEYNPSFGKHVHASRKLCTLFPKGVLASGTGHIFLHNPPVSQGD